MVIIRKVDILKLIMREQQKLAVKLRLVEMQENTIHFMNMN